MVRPSPFLRIWLGFALGAVLLGACRSQQASSQVTASPALTHRISFMVFGDPAELEAYQDLVSAFEQRHPDIRVELIHIPSQTDYRQRLAVDFAAGTPADVVLL
ncbi:MAG: extracellular solute-binding protein, partial [Anaerolineales bacterium]